MSPSAAILRAAIIMMMVQSMVAALVRAIPDGRPSQLLARVNHGLWEGLRDRLRVDDHVTCTLIRCTPDGNLVYAGAHEELLVSRAGEPCERIQTTGTWLGVTAEIDRINLDHTVRLQAGDLVALFTDGVIEAMNASREEFGVDRLAALIDTGRERPFDELRDRVLNEVAAWSVQQRDDVTLMLLRYRG